MTAQSAHQVVIENPVLNSPFREPSRHFRFSETGITNEVVEERRVSSYFIPLPRPKVRGKPAQLSFDTGWTQDRVQPNDFINRVRERVNLWRRTGHLYRSAGGNYMVSPEHLLSSGGVWRQRRRERL